MPGAGSEFGFAAPEEQTAGAGDLEDVEERSRTFVATT
jgi:hypothetical protein